ncbi:hypothetical protein SY83_02755 [Paenibacillus swuensis]|uniref:Putative amidase domain-containing protein n=1 Tax=Paenibacillus swuensis TaxID=1178515 RepID=A0A172TEP0_9BACL|nr:amidase domain-containing protein [Paenibacillus swuensis]ANE45422.1 hypothetical protein SY83_02755 [Paenibacillus swuensis]
MKPDWKSTLYRYVQERNRAELEYGINGLTALVYDDADLQERAARLLNLRKNTSKRGVTLKQRETRARIVSSSSSAQEVRVKLALSQQFRYEHKDQAITEFRNELERLHMVKASVGWKIMRVDALSAENTVTPPDMGGSASVPFMNPSALARSGAIREPIRYNREAAKQYADRYWDEPNPEYLTFEVDCTSFVSQCLFAGGAPMNYTGQRGTGWWYRGRHKEQELWSYSWAVSHSLQNYLNTGGSGKNRGLRAERVPSAKELEIGDVIFYDWEGDSRFQHSTFVTGKDADGMPLVNAHTVNSKGRYWDYKDSYAWTDRTQYRFFHIADFF